MQVEYVCVIAHLELPERDEGEEEDGEEGEEGVGEALVPDRAELQGEVSAARQEGDLTLRQGQARPPGERKNVLSFAHFSSAIV